MQVFRITVAAPIGGSIPIEKYVAASNAAEAIGVVSGSILTLQLLGPLVVVANNKESDQK